MIGYVCSRPEGSSSSTKNTKEHKEGHTIADLILKEEVYAIIGAAIEVHRELGPGFLEPVYQAAMEIELQLRSIPFASQQHLVISYKGHRLPREFIADLVCF